MEKLARFVISFRWWIIVGVIILSLCSVYCIQFIKVDTDILNAFPKDDPEVIFFNETGELFGSNYIAMIAFETDDIFTHRNLTSIRKLTQEYEKLPEVRQVVSLTNILDIKKVEGGLEVGKLVDQDLIPEALAELTRLREYTLGKEMYVGNMISEDGKVALISVRIQNNANKDEVAGKLKEITRRVVPDKRLFFGGLPMVMEFTGHMIFKDMITLIPIVILIVMVTLFLSFGSFRGVALPLITVLFSALFTLAVMSVSGVPITMVSSIMPVVLIATGTAYGIHMMNKYYENMTEEKDHHTGIRQAVSEVGVPIILAGVTTVIGFLSLLTASLTMFKQFGFFTAVGIGFALLLSIFFIPAILSVLPFKPQKRRRIRAGKSSYMEKIMASLGHFVFKHKKSVVVVSGLVVLLAVFLTPGISREVNLISYYPKVSEPRVSETLLKDRFGGSQLFVVDLRASDVKNPFILKEIELLAKRLRLHNHINNPQSIADLVTEMNGAINNRYSIPPTKREIENLWVFIEGQDILEQMVNSNDTEMALQAKIDEIDTGIISRIVEEVNRILQEEVQNNLVIINLNDFSGNVQESFSSIHAENIKERIMLDLEYYEVDIPEEFFLLNDLSQILSRDVHSEVIPRETLVQAMENYFSSGRADIDIDSPKVKAQVINALVALKDQSFDSIVTTLEKELPSNLYEDDPETIEYTAISVKALFSDLHMEQRVMGLMSKIGQKLGIDLTESKWEELYKDLKADLWGVNENQIAVSTADFNKTTGIFPSPAQMVHFDLHLTGMPLLVVKFDKELIQSQMKSIVMAILVVLVLLIFQLRSIIGGFIAIIPISFTILVNFGVMSAMRIPLDNATMMIASIAIGIGIDYTIHFISRFKNELLIQNKEFDSLYKTLETTGKAILINTLAVMLGFMVLIFSSMTPLKRFGFLTSLAMLLSASAALTILPAVILSLKPRFVGEIINNNNKKEEE